MRNDMDRVVIERPRHGGGVRRPKGERKGLARLLRGDPEDVPPASRQSLRQRWNRGYLQKEFSDLLGPLRGYAQSVVGRRFDDVYSEVRRVLSPRSKMQEHAMGHLWDFIVRPSEVVIGPDGLPYRKSGYVSFLKFGYPVYDDEVYVDPRDGIVKRGQHKRTHHRRRPRRETVVKDGRHFRRWNGIWYEVLLAPVPDSVRRFQPCSFLEVAGWSMFSPGRWVWTPGLVVDIILGDVAHLGVIEDRCRDRLREAYGRVAYAFARRQINSRTIRRLGLRSE